LLEANWQVNLFTDDFISAIESQGLPERWMATFLCSVRSTNGWRRITRIFPRL
jgi:hypothetical protein